MKTKAEVIDWLKTVNKLPTVLLDISNVKVAGSPATFYLSTNGFVTTSADTPSNTAYIPIVSGGISYNSSIDSNGQITIGYGSINIYNDGSLNSWYSHVWTASRITILVGDATWPKSDFYQIFTGNIVDLAPTNPNELTFVISDKLQRLNVPISEVLVSTTDITNDQLVPITFGEVFNVTPTLVNSAPSVLEYQVHLGPIEDIIEVRDNGIPVSITKLLLEGKFRLNQALYGTLTCSVQGAKLITNSNSYSNSPINIVRELLENYGTNLSRFNTDEIDITTFSSYASTFQSYPVGVYLDSKENILDIINKILSSIGVYLYIDRMGKATLKRFQITGEGSSWSVTDTDILNDSLNIEDKPIIRATTKIAYCKNYTVQTTLAAGILESHIPVFKREWLYAQYTNSVSKDLYELAENIEEEETLLQTKVAASTECIRRNSMWSTNRYIYSMTCTSHLLLAEVGDSIQITSSKLGLSGGVSGVITSIDKDWVSQKTTLGVLI